MPACTEEETELREIKSLAQGHTIDIHKAHTLSSPPVVFQSFSVFAHLVTFMLTASIFF